jgi:uncharacterized protein with von Willebrand factor type A (vWA) domain
MEGDREIWSKAFTMGVLEIAQIQKRDFAFIAYDSRAEDPIIIKKGEISPDKVITICEEFLDGGGPKSLCRHKIPRTAEMC